MAQPLRAARAASSAAAAALARPRTAAHSLTAAAALASAAARPAGPAVRTVASTAGASGHHEPAPEVKPDYYRLLGVGRTATPDEIKAAFREAAKRHHPDMRAAQRAAAATAAAPGTLGAADAASAAEAAAAAASADVEAFKLVNEAYSVLSDSALRREYDSDRFSRTALLRRRNEGWRGDIVPRDDGAGGYRPWTSAQRGEFFDASAKDAAAGYGSAGDAAAGPHAAAGEASSHEEAFRASMARVSARYQETLKSRASMARVNRAKVRETEGEEAGRVGVVACGAWTLT
jgi:curved DNA-binding protein